MLLTQWQKSQRGQEAVCLQKGGLQKGGCDSVGSTQYMLLYVPTAQGHRADTENSLPSIGLEAGV